jgi:hypothetical protein
MSLYDDLSVRWGFSFLRSDMKLSYEERIELVEKATEMYLNKEMSREVKGDSYEGNIVTKGEHQMLGEFGGQRFDAVIDTNKGKARLEFLITEKINPNWN